MGKSPNCLKISIFPAPDFVFGKEAIVFGEIIPVFGRFLGIDINAQGNYRMRKKNFKGRCEKRSLSKCHDVCRTYDPIQYAYADMLQADDDIAEIRCNVLLGGLELGEFTTDFVCVKTNNFVSKPIMI